LFDVSKSRPGLVAQQEIDDAQSKDLVAEAQIEVERSALAAATEQVDVNKAELAKINTLFDYTRVTAPFAGVVTKRYADTGSMIQAGTASQTQVMPLVRLSENGLLRLFLPVPESVVPKIHVGQQVDVHVPALNRTFPGKVARSAEKVDLSTRTMDTQVDVPNPGLILIPGMYAEVNLGLEDRRHVTAIPLSAVDRGADSASNQVMVVTTANRVEVRKVTLGLETANLVEVVSGLNEGEMVVIGNRAALEANEKVTPKVTALAATKE
jgi:RND family efflux transporter MFP subunit